MPNEGCWQKQKLLPPGPAGGQIKDSPILWSTKGWHFNSKKAKRRESYSMQRIMHVCSQKRCFSMQLLSCPVWILASLIALRYGVWRQKHTRNAFPGVIPEEKISQTPILPYDMLSWQQLGLSEWEQLDVTACWLPEEALPFQNRRGCRMFSQASVTLGRNL